MEGNQIPIRRCLLQIRYAIREHTCTYNVVYYYQLLACQVNSFFISLYIGGLHNNRGNRYQKPSSNVRGLDFLGLKASGLHLLNAVQSYLTLQHGNVYVIKSLDLRVSNTGYARALLLVCQVMIQRPKLSVYGILRLA